MTGPNGSRRGASPGRIAYADGTYVGWPAAVTASTSLAGVQPLTAVSASPQ